MLGGLGIVISIILFFVWRKSTKRWQKIIAWIAGIWALLSIIFYAIILLAASSS